MLRYNIDDTGFLSYDMCKLEYIYFWSKRVVKGPAKGERQRALSESTTNIQQRYRHKEARELTGSLLFGFNWEINGSRSQIRNKKKKRVKGSYTELHS